VSGANSGANYFREQYRFGLLCCIVIFAAEKVAIGVERDRGLRVPSPGSYHMHRHAALEQERKVGVPQTVERDGLMLTALLPNAYSFFALTADARI